MASLNNKISPQDEHYTFLTKTLDTNNIYIQTMAGDASARRYFRVIANGSSWVLMSWKPFEDIISYPFLSIQKHFLRNAINVPQVINISNNEGLVLLEDLGDLTLERKFWESQDAQKSLPFYKLALDELIKIHHDATIDSSDNTAKHQEFTIEKFMWEMNYAKKHLLNELANYQIDDMESQSLDEEFHDICKTLYNEPKVIVHRDYHSRNLMIHLNRMCVIDFQDARMGPIQYDLVSLFMDSYVNLHPSTINELTDYYLQSYEQKTGMLIERNHFSKTFNLQCIQRMFKACGSFSSFYNERQDTRYLKYLNPTLKKLYAILKDNSDYTTFIKVFEKANLLNKDYQKL